MDKTITRKACMRQHVANYENDSKSQLSVIGTVKKGQTKKKLNPGMFGLFLLSLFLISPLLKVAAQTASQNITVKGKVVDSEDNVPIPGISLTNAITKKMLGQTNNQGEFSITIAKGTIVNFSMIGYNTNASTFSTASSDIVIVMKSSSSTLEAVVVTALGIKREERSLGYATTTVSGEQLTDAIAGNWTDALSGKVAGLNLVRSNSGPTGSNKIILRGENNLTGDNEALIVVDGVVVNSGSGKRTAISGESVYATGSDNLPADYGSGINDINPEDIESVTVLKGPGAAALYGQRGANGAIIITTKSGTANKKGLGVTINSNTSFESINRWPDLQFEYGQGLDGALYYSYGATADGASTSGTSSAYGPRFEGQYFYQWDPVTQTRGVERTPWVPYTNKLNQYFEVGSTYNNSISLDGGTDKTTARFSFTDVRNKWIMPNTGYNRNSLSLSVNSKVNDKLTISSKILYNKKWSDNLPSAGYGNQSIMYWYIFWQPNADLDWLKNYWKNGQEGRAISYPFSSFPENPYAIANEFLNKSDRDGVTGNVQANYSFTKALNLMIRTSVDLSYEQRAQERPYDAGTRLPKGSYRVQNIFSQEITSDFLLRYNKKIHKDFNITASVGGSTLQNRYNRDEVRIDSLVYPGVYSLSNNLGPLVTMPYKAKYKINSLYGMFSSSYKDYLYLDLTARNDWSSILASPQRTNNVGFFYPSVSVSFIPSSLFKLPNSIDFAKLRASWSEVGSGALNPYLTAFNYTTAGSLYNGGLTNPGTLANPDLKPLSTRTFEVGAELKMFKNRVGLDLALYKGVTDDQILDRIVDRSTGYSRMVINAGSVSNKGIELSINATAVTSKNGLNWKVFYTFSANRNKILKLADSSVVLRTGPVGGGQIVANVGGSMGDLYGRGFVNAPDGQIVFDGTTGFALISQDVKYLGNTIPKWKMSIGNEFRYKRFRLNVLFDAQYGAVAHSLMNYKMVEQGKLKSTLPGRYSGIVGNGVVQNADGSYRKNDVATYDIDEYYRSVMGQDNAEGSTFSTDFLKFREARLDYTFDAKLIKRLGLQKATVGVFGRNLFIWSPWPMFDPEFGTLSGTDIVQGFETGQFPSTRTFGLNLVVGF
ncbi:SusC/RagA family TonB-linked outer membrane protein [Pedobacter sp. ASV28]|uniref:SusC/RagA family TonB-linked outer membrane protein n=1 Tax=Pedobacter sp. ASV28 TaxID=2795123 RepID=UPI001E4E4C39|nr:SusC/RagA family TonB-linked outer membrane protein [Pedobacter sp. ASV28]